VSVITFPVEMDANGFSETLATTYKLHNLYMREKPTNTPIIHSIYLLCMVAPKYFGITLPSSGSVPSVFWEMLNYGAFDRILWMGAHSQYAIDCSSIQHLSEGIKKTP
jgi:hypothetical protein